MMLQKQSTFILLFIFMTYSECSTNLRLKHGCEIEKETYKCIVRYEMKFDFAEFVWHDQGVCKHYCLCSLGVDFLYYEHAPYTFCNRSDCTVPPTGLLAGLLDEAVKLCCFGCNRVRYRKPISKLGAMFSSELNNVSYTAIFPILATKTIKTYFAGPFISMMSTPGVTYVYAKADIGESYRHLMDALSNTWPLLVLSILLSLNAGFVIWMLDTKSNKDNFPRPFPTGALEGGWWAFVSMTTVGYGDKCPQSLLARVFAALWIIFGIALSGIFTASITTALTVSLSSETINLGKKRVGVLNITRYEQNIALRENAVPVEFPTIAQMKDALKTNTVDGLLIDNNVLGYYWNFLKDGMTLSVNTKIKNSDTTYGIMFATSLMNNDTKKIAENKAWADFLSTFFEYNKDNENIMLSMARQSLEQPISQEPFVEKRKSTGLPQSVYNLLFVQIGYSSAAMLAIGLTYEIIRRVLKKKNLKITATGLQANGIVNKSADIEMENLEAKAENLIHDLEKILTKMKTKNNNSEEVVTKV